jgi:hypothetical protein
MLKSNQVILTLPSPDYSAVCQLLQHRSTLCAEVRTSQRTDRSGSIHPNVELIAEIDKKTIHILGKAALEKILENKR